MKSIQKKIRSLRLWIAKLTLVTKQIPPTVRRFELRGDGNTSVDLKSASKHLTELNLAWSEVQSLEGLGLDAIPIITLQYLSKLTSLTGLGARNQSVTIRRCEAISDFSALRGVPKISIEDCKKLRNLEDLTGVKDLTLTHFDLDRFHPVLPLLHSLILHISRCSQLSAMPEILAVPHLEFQVNSVPDLRILLKTQIPSTNKVMKFRYSSEKEELEEIAQEMKTILRLTPSFSVIRYHVSGNWLAGGNCTVILLRNQPG